MKKILLITAATFFITMWLQAQTNTFPSTGSAGIGTTSPDASSLLEINSNSKGILIPRMSKAQRDAIASPATGLLIYQINAQPGFYYFNGSGWGSIASKGANTSLSNLAATTSINQNLQPNADNSLDLGSASKRWNELYVNSIKFMDGTTQSTAGGGGGGAETDPQVGTISIDRVPRWSGTELTTGLINDNGLRIAVGGDIFTNAKSSFYNKSSAFSSEVIAVRGIDRTLTVGGVETIHTFGYLGYAPEALELALLPISANHIGVYGKQNANDETGAGIYGTTTGNSTHNYGVVANSSATGTNNYGLIAKSTGAGLVNRAIYAEATGGSTANYAIAVPENGGNSGFGWATPSSILGVKQNGTTTPFRVINDGFSTDFIVTTTGKVGVGMDPSVLSATFSVAGTQYVSDRLAIGVGVATSPSALTIAGTDETVTIEGTNPYLQIENGGDKIGYVRASGTSFIIATNAENDFGKLVLRTNGSDRMYINESGSVVIGSTAVTPASGFKLSVDGGIMCEELKVQLSPWADYVFKENYKLMPLEDVKIFVQTNNHLPGIPSASIIENEGLNVGEMQAMMMEKIEELTLYIIDLNEQNKVLIERVSELENK